MAKIIITSTQYPYYGGAATNAYAIIKMLRRAGYDVAGVFFTEEGNTDPDKIGGVWGCQNKEKNRIIAKRFVRAYLRGEPDIIFGKNYVAPVMSRKMWPKSKVVYLVAGSPHMIKLSEKKISAVKYISNNSIKPEKFPPERACIKASDLVIPNSNIGKRMLLKNYGNIRKITNPIDTSLALNRSGSKILIPFNKRKYDVVFVCSNLSRSVKNSELVRKIYSNRQMSMFKKVVIGKNNNIFQGGSGLEKFNLLSHQKLMRIIADSRLIICTSYYDASPNVIKEALAHECNVLVSKNCGWSESYPDEFVCKDVYDIKEWISKSRSLIQKNINFNILSNNQLEKEFELIIKRFKSDGDSSV